MLSDDLRNPAIGFPDGPVVPPVVPIEGRCPLREGDRVTDDCAGVDHVRLPEGAACGAALGSVGWRETLGGATLGDGLRGAEYCGARNCPSDDPRVADEGMEVGEEAGAEGGL